MSEKKQKDENDQSQWYAKKWSLLRALLRSTQDDGIMGSYVGVDSELEYMLVRGCGVVLALTYFMVVAVVYCTVVASSQVDEEKVWRIRLAASIVGAVLNALSVVDSIYFLKRKRMAKFDVVLALCFYPLVIVAVYDGGNSLLTSRVANLSLATCTMLLASFRMYIRKRYIKGEHDKISQIRYIAKAVSPLWEKHKALLFLLFVLLCVTAAESALIPVFIGQGISAASDLSDDALLTNLIGLGVVFLVGEVCRIAQVYSSSMLFAHGLRDLQSAYARKMVYLPTDHAKTPALANSGFSQGIFKVQNIWIVAFWNLFNPLLSIIVNLAFLGSYSVFMMLGVISTIPLIYSLQTIKELAAITSRKYQLELGQLQGTVDNFLSLRNSRKIFHNGEWLLNEHWMPKVAKATRMQRFSLFFASSLQTTFTILNSITYILFAFYMLIGLWDGQTIFDGNEITSGTAFTILGLVNGITTPLATIAGFSRALLSAIGPIDEVIDFIKDESFDCGQDESLENNEGEVVVGGMETESEPVMGVEVKITELTFSYPSNPDKIVLNKINLIIERGQFCVMMGASGCGKSTLLGLLGGLLKASGGDHQISTGSKRNISMALQFPEILSGSIKDNISFGGRQDLEKVQDAAKAAEIFDTIMALPKQFDTILGRDSKVHLSGGQAARLQLARNLYRDPALLLLDEVTASLDPVVSASLLETISKINKTKKLTIIFVTHDLQVAKYADVLCCMADGKVAEFGTYDELMKNQDGVLHTFVNKNTNK